MEKRRSSRTPMYGGRVRTILINRPRNTTQARQCQGCIDTESRLYRCAAKRKDAAEKISIRSVVHGYGDVGDYSAGPVACFARVVWVQGVPQIRAGRGACGNP